MMYNEEKFKSSFTICSDIYLLYVNFSTGTPTIPVIPQTDKLPTMQPPMVLPNFSMGAPTGNVK